MRVVAYCRYSSEAQRDGYSIEAQVRAIKEYCKKNGYKLIKTYVDEARSATTDARENFQKMVEDSKQRNFEAVIVHKLDRFARNRFDSATYKKRLRDNGVRVLSVTEFLDDSPESVILESVLEGMAEYYSKNLSRETKKGKREAARKGKYTGGGIPLGYDVDDDNYFVINESEAAIIRDLFNKISGGLSLYQTAKYAVQQGYRNKNGNYINIYFIRHMLRNPIYAGRLVYGKKPHTGEGEFYVENACEPIIDPDIFWEQYNKAMSRNTGPVPKRRSQNDYVLTGYLTCGYCGSDITGYSKTYKQKDKSGKPKYHYERYRCPKSRTSKRHFEPGHPKRCTLKQRDKAELEGEVLTHIIRALDREGEAWKNLAEQIMNKIQVRIDKIKQTISKNDTEMDRLVGHTEKLLEMFLDGEISKNEFHEENARVAKDINELREETDELRAFVITTDKGAIKKAFKTLNVKKMKAHNINNLRNLLSSFVESIIVTNDDIQIKFKLEFEPSSALVRIGGVEGIGATLHTNGEESAAFFTT